MKILLLLFGASFRHGNQYNRTNGSEKSFEGQMEASESQMKFIKQLQKQGHNVKVSINTYSCKYDENIKEVFNEMLVDYMFNLKYIGQHNLIKNCANRVNISEYDSVLCMRIDIFLKEEFFNIFDPNYDKIMFPSLCWKWKWRTEKDQCGENIVKECKGGKVEHPRISDIIMYVPFKYLDYLKQMNLSHDTWYELVETYKLTYDDIDVMLTTHHDSDSRKDWNPLYYIVNRIQNDNHQSPTLRFNKYDTNTWKNMRRIET